MVHGPAALVLALACTLAPPPPAAPPEASPALRARVDEIVRSVRGRLSFHAVHLPSGASLGRAEDEPVRTASTIKLPVMVEAFARVAEGGARRDETLVLTEAAKVQGAGVLFELDPGPKLTLRDAVRLMIVLSDTTAANPSIALCEGLAARPAP
jgi:beta-lactamase class A